MTKDEMWFRRREKPKQKCPKCGEVWVELGASMCLQCAQKYGVFGEG